MHYLLRGHSQFRSMSNRFVMKSDFVVHNWFGSCCCLYWMNYGNWFNKRCSSTFFFFDWKCSFKPQNSIVIVVPTIIQCEILPAIKMANTKLIIVAAVVCCWRQTLFHHIRWRCMRVTNRKYKRNTWATFLMENKRTLYTQQNKVCLRQRLNMKNTKKWTNEIENHLHRGACKSVSIEI